MSQTRKVMRAIAAHVFTPLWWVKCSRCGVPKPTHEAGCGWCEWDRRRRGLAG